MNQNGLHLISRKGSSLVMSTGYIHYLDLYKLWSSSRIMCGTSFVPNLYQ